MIHFLCGNIIELIKSMIGVYEVYLTYKEAKRIIESGVHEEEKEEEKKAEDMKKVA